MLWPRGSAACAGSGAIQNSTWAFSKNDHTGFSGRWLFARRISSRATYIELPEKPGPAGMVFARPAPAAADGPRLEGRFCSRHVKSVKRCKPRSSIDRQPVLPPAFYYMGPLAGESVPSFKAGAVSAPRGDACRNSCSAQDWMCSGFHFRQRFAGARVEDHVVRCQ